MNLYYYLGLIYFIFAIFYVRRRPKRAVYVAVFFLPWITLEVKVGIGISYTNIIWFLLLFYYSNNYLKCIHRSSGNLILFSVWCIAWTLLQPFDLLTFDFGEIHVSSYDRMLVRLLSQAFYLVLTVSPAIIIPYYCKSYPDIERLGAIYLWSIMTLCFLGMAQYFVFIVFGINLFPIGDDTNAMFELGGVMTFRISSLGGEPRDFAAYLVGGLLLISSLYLAGWRIKYFSWMAFLMLYCLYLTSSTSGFILLLASILVFLWGILSGLLDSAILLRRIALFLLSIFALVIMISAAYETQGSSGSVVLDTIYVRLFQRMDQNSAITGSYLEDFDAPISKMLDEDPLRKITGVGLGAAHLNADKYLLPIHAEYAHDTLFVAKRGYLRLISEVGIIGLFLYMLAFFKPIMMCLAAVSSGYVRRDIFRPAILFCCGMLFNYIISTRVYPLTFIALGVLLALVKLPKYSTA